MQTGTQLTAAQIADHVHGLVEGNPQAVVTRISSLDALPDAGTENGTTGALSFLYDPKFAPHLYTTQCSAVILGSDFVLEGETKATLIRVKHPYSAFNKILTQFFNHTEEPAGIDKSAYLDATAIHGEGLYLGPLAQVHAGCKLGKNVRIGGGAYIGKNVTIGDGSIVYPNAMIAHGCVLGRNVIIHSGVVIGGDGFGYLQEDGKNVKIPQVGNVVIEDEVEIQSNATIDRGTLGPTLIKRGVKIDNLVHIAHNVEIGEYTVIAAQVGIAGSSKIGKMCMIGGQVGIVPKVVLGDFTRISAQSGISKSVTKKNKVLRGSPARDINQQLKLEALTNRLPELLKRIEDLERTIAQLESREL